MTKHYQPLSQRQKMNYAWTAPADPARVQRDRDPTVPFGKYKGQPLETLLQDRSYCLWLLDQDWFDKNGGFISDAIERRYSGRLLDNKEKAKVTKDLKNRGLL